MRESLSFCMIRYDLDILNFSDPHPIHYGSTVCSVQQALSLPFYQKLMALNPLEKLTVACCILSPPLD